jgi:hypothetical protein
MREASFFVIVTVKKYQTAKGRPLHEYTANRFPPKAAVEPRVR